jgi:hypothetical protein
MGPTERDIRHLAQVARAGEQREAPAVVLPDNIVEFATDPAYLDLELYPKQATVLKIATLAVDAMTPFDHEVITEWGNGFVLDNDTDELRYLGSRGAPPDIFDRMEWCAAQGWPWFREIVLIVGRRGSKSFLASIVLAWRLAHLLALGDPQAHYRIPATKQLALHTFGTDVVSLRRNGYGDICGLLRTAPFFQPFRGAETTAAITLLTPRQISDGARVGVDPGLVSVVPAATTFSSGRGPASPALAFDEFAFVRPAGATVSSTDLYRQATPAVMQFRDDAMIIQTSSPWDKTGQLFASYQRGLAVDPDTETAKDPGTFVLQLPSWDLYTQDEPADQIPMWPGGPVFPHMEPKITEAQVVALAEQGNDVSSEYLGHFGGAVNRYLRGDKIKQAAGPYNGQVLVPQTAGLLQHEYVAHADPSRSGANFAFAIGHLEYDDNNRPHVVFDLLAV